MQSSDIISKSKAESTKLILNGFRIGALICILDFFVVCIIKHGDIKLKHLIILLSALLCFVPILYAKRAKTLGQLQAVCYVTVELITMGLMISTWVYGALLSVLSFSIFILYYEPKMIKRILICKIPLIIVTNLFTCWMNPGKVIEVSVSSSMTISIYSILQIAIIGYMYHNMAKKTRALLDEFVAQKENLNQVYQKNIAGTQDIEHNLNQLYDRIRLDNELTENISNTIQNVYRGSVKMSEKATDSQQLVDDMFVKMEEVNQKSNEVVRLADEMGKTADITNQKFNALLEHVSEIGKTNQRSRDEFLVLLSSTKAITNAIEMIASISKQTNLLSLNASIEAARAGEQGRGFAIVAQEILKLAQETSQSAKEIFQLLENIDTNSEQYMKLLAEADKIVSNNIEIIYDSKHDYDRMYELQRSVQDHLKESSSLIASLKGNAGQVQNTMFETYTQAKSTKEDISGVACALENIAASLSEVEQLTQAVQKRTYELVNSEQQKVED